MPEGKPRKLFTKCFHIHALPRIAPPINLRVPRSTRVFSVRLCRQFSTAYSMGNLHISTSPMLFRNSSAFRISLILLPAHLTPWPHPTTILDRLQYFPARPWSRHTTTFEAQFKPSHRISQCRLSPPSASISQFSNATCPPPQLKNTKTFFLLTGRLFLSIG